MTIELKIPVEPTDRPMCWRNFCRRKNDGRYIGVEARSQLDQLLLEEHNAILRYVYTNTIISEAVVEFPSEEELTYFILKYS